MIITGSLAIIAAGSLVPLIGMQMTFLESVDLVPKSSCHALAESITETITGFQELMTNIVLWHEPSESLMMLGALYFASITAAYVSMASCLFFFANLLFILPVALSKNQQLVDSKLKPLAEKAP